MAAHPLTGPAVLGSSTLVQYRVGKSFSDRRVRAAAPVDGVPHSYFVFADGWLLRVDAGSTQAELIAEVPAIREVGQGTDDGRLNGKELELGLYVHGPWVCVTERFGINASLINTSTGAVRGLGRADYHAVAPTGRSKSRKLDGASTIRERRALTLGSRRQIGHRLGDGQTLADPPPDTPSDTPADRPPSTVKQPGVGDRPDLQRRRARDGPVTARRYADAPGIHRADHGRGQTADALPLAATA